jgi:hypothetical protein
MKRAIVQHFLQLAQFARRAAQLQTVAVAANSDSRRVVAAIFEPAQSLNNDRDDFRTVPDVSDNAAHNL